MQLTRIDRWLREHFVYETHVFTLRVPPRLPGGVIAQDLPDTPGRTYRHRFIARDPKRARQLIRTLKQNNQMFATRIVDRNAWYVPLIAPKDKSLVYWLLWVFITAALAYTIVAAARAVWANPELREEILDALKILQG